MVMRHAISACFAVLLLACSGLQSEQEAGSRPNIIYILADDLGYGDLSCYNPESKIHTPHLDQLAEQGMRFTDMHSPSSVCTPTRYGILTGQYCWRSRLPQGVLRGYGRTFIDEKQETVAEMLQTQGYRTAVVGKWHLGIDWVLRTSMDSLLADDKTQVNEQGVIAECDPQLIDFDQPPTRGPLDHGFDYSFVLPASLDMDPYCYLENDILVSKPTAHTPGNDLDKGYAGRFWRAGLMSPDFDFDQVLPNFRKKAISFLDRAAQDDQPFFLYLPLAAPHTPWTPTSDYQGRTDIDLYGDFVEMVDAEVGAVLQKLDDLQLHENTLVIFTSDNGPFWTPALIEKYGHRAAGSLRGMKADAYEGGHRIPYLARLPGTIKAGTKSAALNSLTHLYATLADLLNLTPAEGQAEDSRSLLPALRGESSAADSIACVIHHSSRAYFAVRQGDWKLIEGLGSGGFSKPASVSPETDGPTGQLYNLHDDPGEEVNLYLHRPDVRERLALSLKNSKKQGGMQ